MSRILLADDSPHAQRIGERILRDEGHEVITVSDGRVAMLRLEDAQPDLILADMSMPEVTGFELCEYVKRTSGAPVILTAGPVEPVDEAQVDRVRADGILRKPFDASLEGNTRRAIDVHEGDKLDETALAALIRAAVALNTSGKPARARKAGKRG